MDGVVHFEIPIDNVKRATEFYKKLFGWDIQKAGEMPYWMARTSKCDENMMPVEVGKINGGFYERGGDSSPNPSIVIKVKNIDEHVKKIKSAGGKVLFSVRNVGDMGKYTQFKDTEGNIVGLWQDLKF